MKNILKTIVLIFIFALSQACKKTNPTNKIYRDRLVDNNLSVDSLERMNVVFDKLDLKKTSFLDYFFKTYYYFDIEATKELQKMSFELNSGLENDAFFDKHQEILIKNKQSYLKSLQINSEDEKLIEEIYFDHLKPLIEKKIDDKLSTIER